MPLKPESPASWPIWVSSAVNCVERLARTVVSVVCWAWLTRDWADCTSFVIDVMPLFAAWMVLIALDIESSRPLKSLARLSRDWAVK